MAFDGRKLDFLPITDKAPKLTVYMGWHVRTHTDPGMQIIRSTSGTRLREAGAGEVKPEESLDGMVTSIPTLDFPNNCLFRAVNPVHEIADFFE